MMQCTQCGDDIAPARHALGYRVCLACGDKIAREQTTAMRKACVPMHRSNYVYIGTGDAARSNVLDISAMRRG